MATKLAKLEGAIRVSTKEEPSPSLSLSQCESSSYGLSTDDPLITKFGNGTIVPLDQIAGGDPTEVITIVDEPRCTFLDPNDPDHPNPNNLLGFRIRVNKTLSWISKSPSSSSFKTIGSFRDPPVSHSFSIPFNDFMSDNLDWLPQINRELRRFLIDGHGLAVFYWMSRFKWTPGWCIYRDKTVGGSAKLLIKLAVDNYSMFGGTFCMLSVFSF